MNEMEIIITLGKFAFATAITIIGWFIKERFVSIDNNLKNISNDISEIKTYIAVNEEHKKNIADKIDHLGERVAKLENALSI